MDIISWMYIHKILSMIQSFSAEIIITIGIFFLFDSQYFNYNLTRCFDFLISYNFTSFFAEANTCDKILVKLSIFLASNKKK